MEEPTKFRIAFLGGLTLGIILGVASVLLMNASVFSENHEYTINYKNSSYEAYGLNARNDGFIFITTKDRTIEDISRTAIHEVCHEMIKLDKEHFCES